MKKKHLLALIKMLWPLETWTLTAIFTNLHCLQFFVSFRFPSIPYHFRLFWSVAMLCDLWFRHFYGETEWKKTTSTSHQGNSIFFVLFSVLTSLGPTSIQTLFHSIRVSVLRKSAWRNGTHIIWNSCIPLDSVVFYFPFAPFKATNSFYYYNSLRLLLLSLKSKGIVRVLQKERRRMMYLVFDFQLIFLWVLFSVLVFWLLGNLISFTGRNKAKTVWKLPLWLKKEEKREKTNGINLIQLYIL